MCSMWEYLLIEISVTINISLGFPCGKREEENDG